ncbi:hypothetical protein C0Q70_14632 [Pomacea canaliculata]|uniref:guanylate cyclase n=1 Tax=Pomacea canaliculata TaxID=400727 RepID=A0A2T7NSN3_POMCA|nr:hypothetical protein C0Q70_14632 [Pomacea canaliculata]
MLLDLPVEAVLRVFGGYFFGYCLRHGYDKMLKTLGGDMVSFIQNLDSLHSLLALSYNGISAPSFRSNDGTLVLHYYSTRPGSIHRLVEAVGRDLFQQTVILTVLDQGQEDMGHMTILHHTAFRVDLHGNATFASDCSPCALSVTTKRQEGRKSGDEREIAPAALPVDRWSPEGRVENEPQDLCTALPYHVVFDVQLRVRQCGVMVRHFAGWPVGDGTPLEALCSIVHPIMQLSIDNIFKFINAVFLVAIHRQGSDKPFLLKAANAVTVTTIIMATSKVMSLCRRVFRSNGVDATFRHMIFISSPRLTSLNELLEMKVYLADIPLYDVTRELVLLNQQRIAEIDVGQLDEKTAELRRTSRALEEEKQKTEGCCTDAATKEKFDIVTILFSDIVTFTNIAAACSPLHIVDMLNDLYQRFDSHTTTHAVYKVETIGDAYMVVGGVQEQQEDHAERVASFAMDMVEEAGFVTSPATGLPLQSTLKQHPGQCGLHREVRELGQTTYSEP